MKHGTERRPVIDGFCGAGLQSLQGRRTASEAVWGLLSLASKNRFPGAWEGAARDSVRMRQRPVCSQEFREELGHDGHAIVDAHAIAGLPLESVRAAAWVRLTAAKGLEGRVSGTDGIARSDNRRDGMPRVYANLSPEL